MPELKPCPHCGNHTKPKVMDWDGNGFPGYEVRCDASGWEGLDDRGCGAAGGWGETPDEAVAAWNRRTLSTITPAEVGGLVERLRNPADRYCTQSVREEAASLIQSLAAGWAADKARIAEVELDDVEKLFLAARVEADRAMRKFPQPNYVISKVAEEAGEVVKAAIHCAEGRELPSAVADEIKQAMAMLIRLYVEGDQVHGLAPIAARALLNGERKG